jgi:hypothetical protein
MNSLVMAFGIIAICNCCSCLSSSYGSMMSGGNKTESTKTDSESEVK